MFFEIFGILGLVLLIVNLLVKDRKLSFLFSLIGGIFLIVYSVYIKDVIYIILNSVFSIVALYNLLFRKM